MKKKKNLTEDEYIESLEKEKKAEEAIEKYEIEINQEPQPTEKKKRSKYPIYIAVILIITGLALYLSLKDDFVGVCNVFTNINVSYFIYGVLCFVGIFLINSLILFLFARRYRHNYTYGQGMANDCVANFYNAITPSASGGQVMQAYTYKKQGVTLSNATSCLVMNFIVYQGVLIITAAISIIAKASTIFTSTYDIKITFNETSTLTLPFWIIAMLGFALQFIVIFFTVVMSNSKKFHNFMLNKGVNFFAKLRIIKDPDLTRRKFAVAIESYKIELKNLFINPRFLILIIILQFGVFALRYSIPYFINQSVLGDSLGSTMNYVYSWWDTACYTSIHKMATELIPIPGGAGISEAFYSTLFSPAFVSLDVGGNSVSSPSSYTSACQILWRVITFHVPLVVSGLVTALYKGKPSKEEYQKASEGSVTYYTLQNITIDDRMKTYNTIHNTKLISKKIIDDIRKRHKNKENK